MSSSVRTPDRSRIAAFLLAVPFALALAACGSTGAVSPSTAAHTASSTSQPAVPTTTKATSTTATTHAIGTTSGIGELTAQISAELGALQTLLSQTTADFEAGQRDS